MEHLIGVFRCRLLACLPSDFRSGTSGIARVSPPFAGQDGLAVPEKEDNPRLHIKV